MSEKRVFILAHAAARLNAAQAVAAAPEGWRVSIEPPKKSRDQEALYHAMFAEVARTRTFLGRKHDVETWKRLLVEAFAKVKAQQGEPIQGHGSMIPSLDQTGFIQLGVQTRNFTKKEASEFIEFLHAWMAGSEGV